MNMSFLPAKIVEIKLLKMILLSFSQSLKTKFKRLLVLFKQKYYRRKKMKGCFKYKKRIRIFWKKSLIMEIYGRKNSEEALQEYVADINIK